MRLTKLGTETTGDAYEHTYRQVRGDLGPLTVWMTPDTIRDKHESEEEWKQLYAAVHPASPSPSPSLTLTFTLARALAPTLALILALTLTVISCTQRRATTWSSSSSPSP